MTLVEVAVALSVFAIALLGVVGMANFANAGANATVYQNVAMQATQGILEQVRSIGYGRLLPVVGDGSDSAIPPKSPYFFFSANADVPEGFSGWKILADPAGYVRINYYNPLPRSGIPLTDSVLIPVNAADAISLPNVFVNTQLNAKGATTAVAKIDYKVRLLMTKVNDGKGEGISVDLLYTYRLPGGSGGFRSISGVARTFINNCKTQ